MRKRLIYAATFLLTLSLFDAAMFSCKSSKHVQKTKIDSTGTHITDSAVRSEVEHIANNILQHSKITNDKSEKIIVTTTEEFTPDPHTGTPQLTKRTTHTTHKKNNVLKTQENKTDLSIIDRKIDSAGKKDSSTATVHVATKNRDVKKKTPFGVYAIPIGILTLAGAGYAYYRYKKSRATRAAQAPITE